MSGATTKEDLAAGGMPRGVIGPSGRGGRFLSDVIVELDFAERETVEQALDASRAPGKKLGSTLVEMGILSEEQLGRALAEQYRLDYLDLEEFDVDPEAANCLGDKEMKSYEAAPVGFTEDGVVIVAMVDPADWLAAEEIAQLTGRRVRRAVASAAGVAQVIARFAEAGATREEGTGDALDASAPAPTRLTLRRGDEAHGRRAGTAEARTGASNVELDQAHRDLVARTELEITQADRARLDIELRTTRAELAEARSELATVRAWADAALKRAVDGERGLGEARADVSRLEAELAGARDQVESLRADVRWARGQIEQKDERQDQTLADLRDRIEALQARAATPAEPQPRSPAAASDEGGGPSETPAPNRLVAVPRQL